MVEFVMLRGKVVFLEMKELIIIEVFLNSKIFKRDWSFIRYCF